MKLTIILSILCAAATAQEYIRTVDGPATSPYTVSVTDRTHPDFTAYNKRLALFYPENPRPLLYQPAGTWWRLSDGMFGTNVAAIEAKTLASRPKLAAWLSYIGTNSYSVLRASLRSSINVATTGSAGTNQYKAAHQAALELERCNKKHYAKIIEAIKLKIPVDDDE